MRKISSAACGFSLIKIHYSDYSKGFINRINEVYVFCFFSLKYRYNDLETPKLIAVFIVDVSLYCMASVTSASHYQSRLSMHIRGLIHGICRDSSDCKTTETTISNEPITSEPPL